MRITQVTVSYGETQSLPQYSNVKPQLSLTAELEPGDDPETAKAALWATAIADVREQIDLALEANGRRAKHDQVSPRYQVMRSGFTPTRQRLIVIAPNSAELPTRGDFVHASYDESHNLRLGHARAVAAEVAGNYHNAIVLDCSDGDLSPIDTYFPAPQVEPEDDVPEDGDPGIDREAFLRD